MRLNKILAEAGLASRRGAEKLLSDRRVTVNGIVVVEPGAVADSAIDAIAVDGKPIVVDAAASKLHSYIAMNKPAGVVTTANDPQKRPTVFSFINRSERLFTVGRLDRDTEGLLLLTDDGDWAHTITHPSHEIEKEYEAIVDGVPTTESLSRFEEGVTLPDGFLAHGIASIIAVRSPRTHISLVLREGHKRQARLMFGVLNLPVRALKRVRIGQLRLGALETGLWRELSQTEVQAVTSV